MSLPCGLILVEGAGKILFVNNCAKAILRDNTELEVSGNCIVAANPAGQLALQQAFSGALKTRETHYLRLRGGQGYELWLLVTCLAPQTRREPGHLQLQVCSSRAAFQHKTHALRRLFGMSEAEADIAVRIAAGESAPYIALEREVSINTVRTQVRYALQKSGADRITDLVRMVATIPFDWEP